VLLKCLRVLQSRSVSNRKRVRVENGKTLEWLEVTAIAKVISSLVKDVGCVSSGKLDQNDQRSLQSMGADTEEFLKHRRHHVF
jgi:hypothetical protein